MPASILPITMLKHVQEGAATVWSIYHEQPGYPVVDVYIVYNGSVQKVLPLGITYVDENNVEVHFSEARAGFATLVI